MPVAVPQFQRRSEPQRQRAQEVDPITRVLQGLQIAQGAFSIASDLTNIQKAQMEKKAFEEKRTQEAEALARGRAGRYTEPEFEKVLSEQKFTEIAPPEEEEELPPSVLRRTVIGPEGEERSVLLRQMKPLEMEFKAEESKLTREQKAEMAQRKMEFDQQQKALDRQLRQQTAAAGRDLRVQLDQSRKDTQQMMLRLRQEENPAAQKRASQAEAMGLVDSNLVQLTKEVDPQNRKNLIQLRMPFGLKSQKWQDYETSALQFLDPIARTRTGAAMPKDEFHKYFQQYFPMPGDSQEMVEFKSRFRQLAIQEVLSGKAYSAPTPEGIAVPKQAAPTAAQTAAPVPARMPTGKKPPKINAAQLPDL